MRPALVDLRAALVTVVAILFAVAGNFGITPEMIQAQKDRAEAALPKVPEVGEAGVLGRLLADPKP